MPKLDNFDLAILRHLQHNNRLTAERTAADIGLPSIADYEQLTREIFFANSDIQKFQTSIVMDDVKVGLAPAF